jgi:dehydrogenase/reductase SDR family member 7B
MFAGKVWWITGASSGIGQALAEALSAEGAKLILSGRNVGALKEAAAKCKTATHILPFEATDFANIPSYVEKAWGFEGRVDGLVNNAGVSQRSLAVDTVFDVYRKIVDIDLMAPIALTQALLPKMVAAGGGHIVAISSVAGIAGVPLRSAYCAAKHGLIGITTAFAPRRRIRA